MAKLFTQIPEELFNHTLWKKASNDYRSVLTVILRYTAFEDMPSEGLLKGQCRPPPLRVLAEEAQVPKSTAFDAIKHFMGFMNRSSRLVALLSGESRIISGQDSGQDSGQEKPVYNILLKGYYEKPRTQFRTDSRTTFRTDSGQIPDTPRGNDILYRETKDNIETTVAAMPPKPADFSITKETVREALQSKGITNKKDQDQLFKSWGAQKTWLGLQHIFSDGFEIQQTPIQALNWVCGIEAWKKPKARKVTPKEIIESTFQDGKIYNGYTCGMNSKGIWFYAGSYSRDASYDSKTFPATFGRICLDLGIENPFEKTINIKEA